VSSTAVFEEISPADFFYRNRDIAGFSNPLRALYSTVRELVENSLDACEAGQFLPDIYVRFQHVSGPLDGVSIFRTRVQDNGTGVPDEKIPMAFGKVLYGSKYGLRQSRGTFGLGGTMALLYGQITTNVPAHVVSSVGDDYVHEYEMSIDIQRNRPNVLRYRTHPNEKRWHGTILEFSTEGDYARASSKVLEYLKQTAMANPYADITFVDPRGRLYVFERTVKKIPALARETKPHPHGADVETVQRLIAATSAKDMLSFFTTHFHRVGKGIARRFLDKAGVDVSQSPKELSPDMVVRLVTAIKAFEGFLPPDGSCLSPLGKQLLDAGIMKELQPEFTSVVQRQPSAYSGYPFVVEVGLAYGGEVPRTGDIVLYRFANKIPLLYDETSDVSWKVAHGSIDWRHYRVNPLEQQLAVVVHVCSTKIPYKTVGKEFLADRPEVEREILNALREAGRGLMAYLSRKERAERDRKRLDVYRRYLPKIARFSTKLSGKDKEPSLEPLLTKVAQLDKAEATEA